MNIPVQTETVVIVDTRVEITIEVIKIVEVIKEVEKIVYQGGGGAASDCDCLTGARFLKIWN